MQSDVLEHVQYLEVLFDLLRARHALVEAVEGGACSVDSGLETCGENQLSNALDVVSLCHKLLADLEVRIVFRDLLCVSSIPYRAAFHHLV